MAGLKNNFDYRAIIAFHNLRNRAVAVVIMENPVAQSPAAVGRFEGLF